MDEDRLLSASSWKEFAQNRRILLKAADHRGNEDHVHIDYNIYRSDSGYRHSAPPEPVHRLSVIEWVFFFSRVFHFSIDRVLFQYSNREDARYVGDDWCGEFVVGSG